MNITFPKGETKIALSKTDRNQMEASRNLCGNLAKHVNGTLQQAALTAEAGLAVLLAEFRTDAAQSEPDDVRPIQAGYETAAAEARTANLAK